MDTVLELLQYSQSGHSVPIQRSTRGSSWLETATCEALCSWQISFLHRFALQLNPMAIARFGCWGLEANRRIGVHASLRTCSCSLLLSFATCLHHSSSTNDPDGPANSCCVMVASVAPYIQGIAGCYLHPTLIQSDTQGLSWAYSSFAAMKRLFGAPKQDGIAARVVLRHLPEFAVIESWYFLIGIDTVPLHHYRHYSSAYTPVVSRSTSKTLAKRMAEVSSNKATTSQLFAALALLRPSQLVSILLATLLNSSQVFSSLPTSAQLFSPLPGSSQLFSTTFTSANLFSDHLNSSHLLSTLSTVANSSHLFPLLFTEKLGHTGVFTQSKLLHIEAFTHRNCYTEKLLDREACTDRSFYTHKLLQREVFAQRSIYTPKLLHAEAFT